MKKLQLPKLRNGDTLEDYLNKSREEYGKHLESNPLYSIPWEDEDLINAILDWDSMRGYFTDDEYEYLESCYGLSKDHIDSLINF